MDKIFIVDAVNILFRSFHAIGPMTNPKGESTNALYGFIRSINKLIKDYSPEHFIAVFDGPSSKEKRSLIYKDYKAHREKMPEDLFQQLERAIAFCELAGIPHLAVPGVEADDTIGSIALWAEKQSAKVYICSSDKDLCQLVSKNIFMLHVHKDNMLVDEAKVKELFGVNPNQIVDLLAIMGDTSDNIPGLEGFGQKTAASLLSQFGTLDALLAHPEKVPGEKKQETLRRDKEIALMSRELAKLHTPVEFPHNEEFFKLKRGDEEALKAFYQQMHFMSLLKALDGEKTETPTPQAIADEKDLNYTLINEPAELTRLIEKLSQAKEICIDTETTDIRPMEAQLVGIGFSLHPKEAWYVPFNGSTAPHKLLEQLQPLLENPLIGFYGHNLKYDLHVLQNIGVNISNISFDTLLASYMINPQNQRHSLDTLALEKFGKVKIPIEELIGKGKKQISMADVPLAQISHYCCEDVDYTVRLKHLFEKELGEADVKEVFEMIELPLLPILVRMERNGIYVNIEKLKVMSHELAHQLQILEQEICEMAGETFNVSSPKQLSHILFEKMGIKPLKKTTTDFCYQHRGFRITERPSSPSKVLELRTLEKLRSTYVDALPEQVNPRTQRIHCTFNQSVAATGRLSSQDPNLQNIPIRTRALGRRIREAFEPEKPAIEGFLVETILKLTETSRALEPRSGTHQKAFAEGEDVHAYTASLVFDTPLAQVTSEMRARAKAVNLELCMANESYRFSEVFDISIFAKKPPRSSTTYFKRYRAVKSMLRFLQNAHKIRELSP